jgi:hypothetical protein
VEHVITAVSFSDTTTSYTWTKTENGTDMSFTIKVVPPNVKVYDWAFSAAPTGQPLQPVMDGYIDRSNATADHDGSGEMDIDFANFHAAFPKEHVASGTIHVAFAVSETSRTISVVADKVTWELDASHFDGGIIPSGLQQPRSGEYLYFRQPGKGGSLKIHDEMVYGCSMDPTVTNANLVPADSQMVSQWYKADDGTIHGRSDGLITGGQLTGTQVDRIVGVTCHNASAEQHMPTEGFWLMKAEKADGSTLLGFSTASVGDTTSSTPCDTKFGPVPALANKDTDFNGWPSSYSEAPPFSYFTP